MFRAAGDAGVMPLNSNGEKEMVTCYLHYVIDPSKVKEFEHYGKLWISLVEKFGGNITVISYPRKARTTLPSLFFPFRALQHTSSIEPDHSPMMSVWQLLSTPRKQNVL